MDDWRAAGYTISADERFATKRTDDQITSVDLERVVRIPDTVRIVS